MSNPHTVDEKANLLKSYDWLLLSVESSTGVKPKIAYEDHRKTVRVTFLDGVPTYRPEWESYNPDGSLAVKFSLNELSFIEKEKLLSNIVDKIKEVLLANQGKK